MPRLIAAGISLTALGDAAWTALDLMGRNTDVSVADPLWFASVLVLCAALWVVIAQSRGPGAPAVDVDSLIDALTIGIVSVLVFWSFSIDAIVADDSLTPFVRAVWSAYPVSDAVLLALVLRVLMSRHARRAIDPSFAVGVCLWLAADIIYLQTPEPGLVQLMMDSGWMVASVLMARAAWRFRGVRRSPAEASVAVGRMTQITIAVGPLMVPPALEITADLRGEPDQPLLLLVGTASLTALAFVRTARLMQSEKRALRELEVARDAALDASRAKSMFLANVSHEIRTPLTTVLATAEVLEDTPLNDLQVRLVGKMNRSGELLKRLVEGLLDFSRIEAGQLELVSTDFDLHAMVVDVAEGYVPRAAAADLRFEWHVDPRLPQSVVGDPGRLFQILSNLLDNALKFTHEGQVVLTARPAEDGVPHDVELLVSDTGIGIREEDLTKVFESFHQVDGSITRSYGGSGLGLAICRELTRMMGGTLTVRSQFGAGTTFVLRLPASLTVTGRPADPALSRSA